ncbi:MULTISPECIES: hypothetical protein [Sphingomonas]|uniref:hypothetical protein n=1 Tax=Sphingomonas TaxID=13687 RepID=UPI00082D58C7|nr:hypothetical protein [Sphingomonas sp. CCH10-B3]
MGIGWGPGGPTDSVNRFVAHEVRRQLAGNPVARRARYPAGHRLLRSLMGAPFSLFLARYLIVDLAVLNVEAWSQIVAPDAAVVSTARAAQIVDIVKTVPSYLLGAQIGLLGIISLALALVTLIAQRDDATTDVKVYYHESMFFGITASGIALAAVLSVQFLWPLQTALHRLGGGSGSPIFKLALVAAHTAWFVVNLWAVAHFVSVTFRFVQRSARERLRERYTANVVVPRQLTDRLRQQVYGAAGGRADPGMPGAFFGYSFGTGGEIEIEREFAPSTVLVDVHMGVVRWVLARWAKRCSAEPAPTGGAARSGPRIWFTPALDRSMRGRVAWCRRNGGVPLTAFERWALRRAFRFEERRDEG